MSINQPSPTRIYLDNAATSFPKPEAVYLAMDRYNRENGVAVGRGAFRKAAELQAEVQQCRRRAAQLVGARQPESIAFTFNGTDSLNLAIHGILREGDHVVCSIIEHNSVLRPLRELERRGLISVTFVPANSQSIVDPDDFRNALTAKTRLVVLTHASNVTGAIQPVSEVGKIARDAGVAFLVDAAQTAGHLPLDAAELHADLIACPGHKGLMGPLGTGLLYIDPKWVSQLQSVRQGGTGTRSEEEFQPAQSPDKYESGNHNAPGLLGLSAALEWLQGPSAAGARDHELLLIQKLMDGLQTIPQIRIYGPPVVEDRVGVVSISVGQMEPQIVASLLDEMSGIEVRAGLHCAPGVHRAIGTLEIGGTVRLSPGRFTTLEEIDAAIEALRQIAEFE